MSVELNIQITLPKHNRSVRSASCVGNLGITDHGRLNYTEASVATHYIFGYQEDDSRVGCYP